MDQKENRIKLLKHLYYVEDNEPDSFDLGIWVNDSNKAYAAKSHFEETGEINCGFAGCVVGHLPLAFKENFDYIPSRLSNSLNIFNKANRAVGPQELAYFFGGTFQDWTDIIYEEEYADEVDSTQEQAPLDLVIKKIQLLHEKLSA